MKDNLTKHQVAQNLKKYNFTSFDDNVQQLFNNIHDKVIEQQLKLHLQKSKHHQQGGRVAFPIEYFGGVTNSYSPSVPPFTNINPSDSYLRPPLALNDPTGVFGTEKGMLSGMVGGASKSTFKISSKKHEEAARYTLQKHNDKQHLVSKKVFYEQSKQKFESKMHDLLSDISKATKSKHLSVSDLNKVLDKKKYKSLKA